MNDPALLAVEGAMQAAERSGRDMAIIQGYRIVPRSMARKDEILEIIRCPKHLRDESRTFLSLHYSYPRHSNGELGRRKAK
jgi:hypothetical protein